MQNKISTSVTVRNENSPGITNSTHSHNERTHVW